MADLDVRPLDPARDLEGFLRVWHEMEPYPRTAAEWRDGERRAAPNVFRRHLVGGLDGEVVGLAVVLDLPSEPDAVAARVVVDPAHRGAGHGAALAAAAERLVAERGARVVETRVAGADVGSRAWAERRGFRPTYTMTRSRLEVADFDAARHRPGLERLEAAGMRFEVPDDPGRFYDLYLGLLGDVPEDPQPLPREVFDRQLEDPEVLLLVARDGPAWAGHVAVRPIGRDGAWNAFTGVLPEYRGRGLAKALKVAAILEVARRGRTWIETMNHSVNAPMLAVNRALGYHPVAVTQFLRRPG